MAFYWGTATASYQIEGGKYDRGNCIWDDFSHQKGKILDNSHGDQACEHYERFLEDVEIMASLHINAYRFSLSWSRLFPEEGKISQKGVDFYHKLIDSLLEKNITPFITLFHWDLPSYLQKKGGFTSRSILENFMKYVSFVIQEYGSKVNHWITFNEPFIFAALGHGVGCHAPGEKSFVKMLRCSYFQLLCHGYATKYIHDFYQDKEHSVGISNAIWPVYISSDHKNLTIREKVALNMAEKITINFYLEPILKKKWPKEIEILLKLFVKEKKKEDILFMSTPIDFLGINHYSRSWIKPSWNPFRLFFHPQEPPLNAEKTKMGWEVCPDVFYDLLKKMHAEYPSLPLMITENGCAVDDVVVDGKVKDSKRIEYLEKYLFAMQKAQKEGVNIQGYFLWSFMDNFEWAEGYTKRFGIVYIDYSTQKRIIKESGFWYKNFIKKGKIND